MARRAVKWTQVALQDLRNVIVFIGRNDVEIALQFGDRVDEEASKLCLFPERQRVVPEGKNANLRELFVGKYRLIYLITPKEVQVIRFFARCTPHSQAPERGWLLTLSKPESAITYANSPWLGHRLFRKGFATLAGPKPTPLEARASFIWD